MRNAFKAFLKAPDEEGLKRLDWLLQNERKLSQISGRVFSWGQWAGFIASILLFITLGAVYLNIRIEGWPPAIAAWLGIGTP